MDYALVKRFEKTFNSNLNVVNGNSLGQILQSDNISAILTIYVPSIDDSKDTCYLAAVLPAKHPTQINTPKALNETFKYAYSENGIDYYKAEFRIDSRMTKYIGAVKLNVVIYHKTGEFITFTDSDGKTYEKEKVSTIVSDTLTLNVARSSNFYSFDLSTQEEMEEANTLITELLKSLSSFSSEFVTKADGIVVFDTLPTDLTNYKNRLLYERTTKKIFFINEDLSKEEIFLNKNNGVANNLQLNNPTIKDSIEVEINSGSLKGNITIPEGAKFYIGGDFTIDEPIHDNNPATKSYVDEVKNVVFTDVGTNVVIDVDNITSEDYYTKILNEKLNGKKPVVQFRKRESDLQYHLYTCSRIIYAGEGRTMNFLCEVVKTYYSNDGIYVQINKGYLWQDKSQNSYSEGPLKLIYSSDKVNEIQSSLTDYIDTKIADIVGSAPEELDTLREIVDAFQNADRDFTQAINDLTNNKVDKTIYDEDINDLKARSGMLVSFDPTSESLIIEQAPDTLEVTQLLNASYGTDGSEG